MPAWGLPGLNAQYASGRDDLGLPMSLYFLTTRLGPIHVKDDEGCEFESDDAAMAEAQSAAREMLAEVARRGGKRHKGEVVVRDAAGRLIGRVKFGGLISVTLADERGDSRDVG